MTARRTRTMVVALTAVAGAGLAGWLAGTQVESSNEATSGARAPQASPVTARVTRRELSADIVARGTARYGESSTVRLAAGARSAGLVTRPPTEGEQLTEGASFMEVDGAPVLALAGERPMYRDLGPGDHGEDVRQLEEALARLGFDPGAVDGTFDGATGEAVRRWFNSAGYTVEGPSSAETADLRAAEDNAALAASHLANEKRQLAESAEAPTPLELLQAESEVARAIAALDAARTRAAADLTTAQRDLDAKQEAVYEARRQEVVDAGMAERTVAEKYAAAELARASLDDARAASAGAIGQETAIGRAALLQAQQAVKRADQELADARKDRDSQPARSARVVADAERALSDARAALPRIKAEGEAAVRDAETSASLATLRLADVRAPEPSAALLAAVEDAEASAARAQRALAEARDRSGARLRASMIVFFPSLPLRVDSVTVKRGDAAGSEIMTVSSARLVVKSVVTIAESRLLRPGMAVAIDAPDIGVQMNGSIAAIAPRPGTDGANNQQVAIEVTPLDPPDGFRDAAVRLVIPVKATDGAVLVVPVAAVSSSAAGSARVDVLDSNGEVHAVAVEVGLSSGGFVEVRPRGGMLQEGDRVVVGAA